MILRCVSELANQSFEITGSGRLTMSHNLQLLVIGSFTGFQASPATICSRLSG